MARIASANAVDENNSSTERIPELVVGGTSRRRDLSPPPSEEISEATQFAVRARYMPETWFTSHYVALSVPAETSSSVADAATRPHHSFELLQHWEGTVVELLDDAFTAQLRDLTNPDRSDGVATISFTEVSDSDLELIARGAVFYWGIGYRRERHGQKTRESSIRFRRLPAWTRSEVQRARALAEEFSALFDDGG